MQAAILPNFIFIFSRFMHSIFFVSFMGKRDQYSPTMSTKIMNIITIATISGNIVTVYPMHSAKAPKAYPSHSFQPSAQQPPRRLHRTSCKDNPALRSTRQLDPFLVARKNHHMIPRHRTAALPSSFSVPLGASTLCRWSISTITISQSSPSLPAATQASRNALVSRPEPGRSNP